MGSANSKKNTCKYPKKFLTCSSSKSCGSAGSSFTSSTARASPILDEKDVSLEHFRILGQVGKGSFGKVYAVERKASNELFAMKLVDKELCHQKGLFKNIDQEIEILDSISHPFLIALWFSFQDENNMYLVFEFLPGGDLRHCMDELHCLPEARVLLYVCEVALALDYLKIKSILHRDVKPENMLIDSHGHVRLTDFNIAIVLKDGELANSMSGTKPYIAPEIYRCVLDLGPGYSFEADWWSLGVCAYEMLCGKRPYDIHSNTTYEDILAMFLLSTLIFPGHPSSGMADLVNQMLCVEAEQRLNSVDAMRKLPHLAQTNFNLIYKQEVSPSYVPQEYDNLS